MRTAFVTLIAAFSLVGACSREVPPRTERPSAAVAQVPDTAVSEPRPDLPAPSIRGDTFLLVAVGSQPTQVAVSDSTPCGYLPYLRVVISDDSSFYRVTDDKETCFGPATDSASHWSGQWSTYRLDRDTLHLFEGDGDETFQWVNGIVSDDSLIQLYADKPFRFVRIRPSAAAARR